MAKKNSHSPKPKTDKPPKAPKPTILNGLDSPKKPDPLDVVDDQAAAAATATADDTAADSDGSYTDSNAATATDDMATLAAQANDEMRAAADALAERRYIHRFIAACERAATKGHGADSDRGLLQEAASLIRRLVGLSPTDELTHIPKPEYAPVAYAPPIGHSLPIPGDSDR